MGHSSIGWKPRGQSAILRRFSMQNSRKSYEDGFCNNLLHFLLLIFSKFMLHKFTNSSNHKPTSGSHQLSYTQGKIFMHANQSSRQELKLVFLLFLLRPILLQLSLLIIAAYRITFSSTRQLFQSNSTGTQGLGARGEEDNNTTECYDHVLNIRNKIQNQITDTDIFPSMNYPNTHACSIKGNSS